MRPRYADNGTVVLKLPTEVNIGSHLRIRDCHDANEGLDVSEPLRVFLSACDVDGLPIPCDKLTIRLQSGTLTAAPIRFKESDKKQGFVVPKEFRALKNFWVSVDTGSGRFVLGDMDIAFLKGHWHLGIDHAPFKHDSPIYNAPATLRCVGFVVFEWGEPEVVVSGTMQMSGPTPAPPPARPPRD